MGMDAFINNDQDLRFSQLLAESTFKLYPDKKFFISKNGYLELSKDQVTSVILEMMKKLDSIKLMDSFIEIDIHERVRYIRSNLNKLALLMEWCKDENNNDNFLTFA